MSLFNSLEPEDRREVIREFGYNFALDVLIETGTNEGKTPWALKDAFREIHTIELYEPLYVAAANLFNGTPWVHCWFGDSTDVLPDLLASIDDPALFWLDGHYSGPGTGHGIKSSPICEELMLILANANDHVILVDDARIFDGGPEHKLYDHYLEYPSLDWIEALAEQYGYDYWLEDDIMRITPR